MSDLEWRDGDFPVSTQFDDPYYSVVDGRAETNHVFIKGNNLNQRWLARKSFTIAELGFGTGLNFMETVRQFQSEVPKESQLHFISFEQYPITQEEMAKALSHWPELETLSKRLVQIWTPETEKIDIEFSPNIHLSIHVGDANTILPKLKFEADAWYLDGFSPAKNLELWNEQLMAQVGKHTAKNGTFATYTAAGFVKRGLQTAGFDVQKVQGFGRKRDMLVGEKPILASDTQVADRH